MIELPTGIGTDFVGYRIEEEIGRGGMGVVYRAYDLRLKRTVALKLVAPELALDERFRERFARETELAMSLEHPNVVPIYDAGDVDGRLYLAMRLVVGTDLAKLLRAEGALEPARAVAICRQVASALDAAHAKGLIHRDVKPSNVLLDESEHVYLADFGLTRRLDEPGARPRRTVARSGRPPISPRSRSRAHRSTAAPTSTRSAACSSSASPARRRSPVSHGWRPRGRIWRRSRRARGRSSPSSRGDRSRVSYGAGQGAGRPLSDVRRIDHRREVRARCPRARREPFPASCSRNSADRCTRGGGGRLGAHTWWSRDADGHAEQPGQDRRPNEQGRRCRPRRARPTRSRDRRLVRLRCERGRRHSRTRVDRRTGAVVNSGQYGATGGLVGEGGKQVWVSSGTRLGGVTAVNVELPEVGISAPLTEHRRAQHMLTGKLFCGCCDGPMTNIGRNYLACSAARRQGTCSNGRGIQRDELDKMILDALQARLMEPEHVAAFVAEFNAEWNRLQAEVSAHEGAKRRELDAVGRKLDGLIDAIARGIRSTSLQQKLDELEARKAELERALQARASPSSPPAPEVG